MFTLRPYQQESSDKAVEFMLGGHSDNGLLVEPTGSGKSLIIADVVRRLDAPCVVFQPSREILTQNWLKFVAYGYNPAIYSASAGQKRIGKITLATIGSVFRKPGMFDHVKYIIVDECHAAIDPKNKDGMFMKFLAAHPDVKVLGLTATPYRLVTDGYGGSILKFITRTRPRVFTKVVHVVQNGDLFKVGWLSKLEYKAVKSGFDSTKLRLNSTGADYTDESLRRHFKELAFDDQVVRCVRRLGELGRKGVLVFTRFVENAAYVASKIPGAAVVSAETPKDERDRIVVEFKAGKIPCVANVGIFGIGFDYPQLANVVLANPTRSLARYYQWVGRCVRTHSSKTESFVVDMVGLVEQFGKVEDLRVECGEHEKWFVSSNGKQLTNVYYGEASKDTANDDVTGWARDLKWGAPFERGGRLVKSARPDQNFWAAWRARKDELVRDGVRVGKARDGEWQVVIPAKTRVQPAS